METFYKFNSNFQSRFESWSIFLKLHFWHGFIWPPGYRMYYPHLDNFRCLFSTIMRQFSTSHIELLNIKLLGLAIVKTSITAFTTVSLSYIIKQALCQPLPSIHRHIAIAPNSEYLIQHSAVTRTEINAENCCNRRSYIYHLNFSQLVFFLNTIS
jgi:hypothetical protein